MNPSWLSFDQFAAATLVAVAWQAALLTLATAIVLRLLPRLSAAARFTAWAAVFFVLLLLPFAPRAHSAAAHSSFHVDPRWSIALAMVWAALSLLRGVQLIRAFLRERSISLRSRPVELPPLADARNARLCLSPDVLRPSVIGFFRPLILIPQDLYAHLTPAELDHVLLHERQHLRRRDDWLNLLQKLGLVLFPLNPALLWVERRLCFERELACDESVLAATNAPQSYARSLVSLAEHTLLGRQLSLALGAWEQRSELSRRIHRILATRAPALSARSATVALTLLCTGLFASAAALSRAPRLVSFASQIPVNFASAAKDLPQIQPTLSDGPNLSADHSVPVSYPADSRPKLASTMVDFTPVAASPTVKARRTVVLRPHSAPTRSMLASYSSPSHTAASLKPAPSSGPTYRTIAAHSGPHNRDTQTALWTQTTFSSLNTTSIFVAVFHSSNASPTYAAVPTPTGWLVFQL